MRDFSNNHTHAGATIYAAFLLFPISLTIFGCHSQTEKRLMFETNRHPASKLLEQPPQNADRQPNQKTLPQKRQSKEAKAAPPKKIAAILEKLPSLKKDTKIRDVFRFLGIQEPKMPIKVRPFPRARTSLVTYEIGLGEEFTLEFDTDYDPQAANSSLRDAVIIFAAVKRRVQGSGFAEFEYMQPEWNEAVAQQ